MLTGTYGIFVTYLNRYRIANNARACLDPVAALTLTSSVALELVVSTQDAGKKIENFLKKKYPIGYVRKLFRKNGVRLNGSPVKAHAVVHPGDRLLLFIPFTASSGRAAANPTPVPNIEILFENTELLVLNKPAGIAAHEAEGISRARTVAGFLDSLSRTPGKPRLVHRLDRDTSGVLLAAKNEMAAAALENVFERREVGKEYACLVAGRLAQDSGIIDFRLPGRDGKHAQAETVYRVQKRLSDTTLVQVRLDTGRMHQIRLHFAALSYPVVMDSRYGDFAFNKSFRKRTGLKRQFLHAARLTLIYGGQRFSWSAPLPQDLQQTLKVLASEPASGFNVKDKGLAERSLRRRP